MSRMTTEAVRKLHNTIIEIYQKDKKKTYQQVADEAGCSLVLVQRVLRSESKEDRKKRNKEILALRNKGLTHQQIADIVSCNRQTVGSVLRQANGYVKGYTIRKGTAYVRRTND